MKGLLRCGCTLEYTGGTSKVTGSSIGACSTAVWGVMNLTRLKWKKRTVEGILAASSGLTRTILGGGLPVSVRRWRTACSSCSLIDPCECEWVRACISIDASMADGRARYLNCGNVEGHINGLDGVAQAIDARCSRLAVACREIERVSERASDKEQHVDVIPMVDEPLLRQGCLCENAFNCRKAPHTHV